MNTLPTKTLLRSVVVSLIVFSHTAAAQTPSTWPPPAVWPDGIESLLVEYFSVLNPIDIVAHCDVTECKVAFSIAEADLSAGGNVMAGLVAQRFNVWQSGVGCPAATPGIRQCTVTLSNVALQEAAR